MSSKKGIQAFPVGFFLGVLRDNAKKYIEEGVFGGIDSEVHKSADVGDLLR